MTQVEKNMAVSALAQLLDQQPTAYAEVLAACRAMGWNASPTAQPADIIDELPSNVLPFIRRMLALLIYGDGSADSPAVVPVTERLYAQMLARQASPNYPAAGFPSDRDPFTHAPSIRDFAHLPQALSALSARKITNGNATNDGIVDGMSLAHLLLDPTSVTEIADDNKGWVCRMALSTLWSIFPNLNHNKLVLHFGSMPAGVSRTLNADAEELEFPDIVEFGATSSYPGQTYDIAFNNSRVRKIKIVGMRRWERGVDGSMGAKCTNLEEIDASSIEYINYSYWHYTRNENSFYGATNLRRVVFGAPKGTFKILDHADDGYGCTKWIDLEFGVGTATNLNLTGWNPTNALDASRTDLIEEGSTAQNNLDQFLQNFREHIALRLTDQGSGKTLTLSQAVYDAIKDETHLFVFDEGTMTIYAYLTNIKHWTVTK